MWTSGVRECKQIVTDSVREESLGLSCSQSLCHNHLSIVIVISLALVLWTLVRCWDTKDRTLIVWEEKGGVGAKARGGDGHISTEEWMPNSQGSLPGTEDGEIKAGFDVSCFTTTLLDVDISVSCTSSFSCPGSLENTMASPRRYTR